MRGVGSSAHMGVMANNHAPTTFHQLALVNSHYSDGEYHWAGLTMEGRYVHALIDSEEIYKLAEAAYADLILAGLEARPTVSGKAQLFLISAVEVVRA